MTFTAFWLWLYGWLKRAAAWAVANPVATLVLGLLGAVGIQTARVAHERRKAAAAEVKATTAVVEGQAAVTAEQRKEIEAGLKTTAGQMHELEAAGEAAKDRQEQAHGEVEDILDKYNRRKP